MSEQRIDSQAVRGWLVRAVRARCGDTERAWFDKANLAAAKGPALKSHVLGCYSGASRKLGKQALLLDGSERTGLHALVPGFPIDHWGLDEAARAALLLAFADLPPGEFRQFALQAYELGDSREQESWLRALWLLPDCGRFRDHAIDACRTNIKQLFEAIACENPYPARFFPELNFNQLAMKCLFMGIEVSRILGLEERLNADLSRMSNDYASEREAAGRAVPADIWLVLAPFAGAGALERVQRYCHNADPLHRVHAALGLGLRRDPARVPELRAWLQQEQEPRVVAAIQSALKRIAPQERSAG